MSRPERFLINTEVVAYFHVDESEPGFECCLELSVQARLPALAQRALSLVGTLDVLPRAGLERALLVPLEQP